MMIIIKIIISLLAVILIAIIANAYEDIRKRNKLKISFKEALDLVEVPIVTFLNNGIKLNFLLDTGSSWSIINESVLPSLVTEKLDAVMNIVAADGNKVPSKFCKMKVSYKDQEFENDFAIRDLDEAFGVVKQESGVQIHGILGSDFLQKYKYVLDFKELIAYPK